MMKYGFHLETLSIRGKGKADAIAEFKGGLNVISGPSNTGKSYIFSCINFLLGDSKAPKPVDEAKGYEWAYLVIRPNQGPRLTFERALKGGSFRMFEGGLDSVGTVLVQRKWDKRRRSLS